jgi:hypothetical protein
MKNAIFSDKTTLCRFCKTRVSEEHNASIFRVKSSDSKLGLSDDGRWTAKQTFCNGMSIVVSASEHPQVRKRNVPADRKTHVSEISANT